MILRKKSTNRRDHYAVALAEKLGFQKFKSDSRFLPPIPLKDEPGRYGAPSPTRREGPIASDWLS